MPRVSVIIPTRDGGGPLRTCLVALAHDFPPDAETIVVSDGGPTDLRTQLADLAEPLALTCVQTTHGGPAHARNRGLEIARGEVVAFTDDDCAPRPGWLAAVIRSISTSPPVAVGGTTHNGVPGNPYADAAQVVLDLVAQHEVDTCGEVRFFPANNCAFPLVPLRALGGFDESYRTAEDRELLRRWRAAGHRVVIAHDAVIDHNSSPTLAGYIRKFYGYGVGAARFHATSDGRSYGDSASFHTRLPELLSPLLKERGVPRGTRLLGLLAVWEVANMLGFVAEMSRRAFDTNGKKP